MGDFLAMPMNTCTDTTIRMDMTGIEVDMIMEWDVDMILDGEADMITQLEAREGVTAIGRVTVAASQRPKTPSQNIR